MNIQLQEETLEKPQEQPHSAPYLGEHRNFWWNSDFLELMAKRWDLKNCKTVLDVGCGTGHWGRALSVYLPDDAKIIGVDREPDWVSLAQEFSKDQRDRFDYKVSTAEKLPFPDNSFDLVTCQTLLLHVDQAKTVLREMARVLKPNGLLLVAEPNNTVSELLYDTISDDEKIEDILKSVEFHLLCERGQQKLKEGFGSIGDLIPGYYHDLGLKDIKVFTSDKTDPLIPPYDTEEQTVYIRQLKEWYETELLAWDKEQSKKYYLAGGGDPELFESTWKHLKARLKRRIDAIGKKKYSTAGGCLLYLISGRK